MKSVPRDIHTIQSFFSDYPYKPNCQYGVDYCCKWDNINKKISIKIQWIWWPSSNPECLIPIDIWEDFRQWYIFKVKSQALDLCAPYLPPCEGEEYFIEEIESPGYYYWVNLYWDKYPNEAEWTLVLRKCPGEYNWCKEVWHLCKNYSTAEIVTLFHDCSTYISGNCPYDEPNIPPEGYGWEDAWSTSCFTRPCCP